MSLLAVASSTRAAAVRPLCASTASSGEAVPAPAPAATTEAAGRRPVKVILPKKKPQKWSTGMAPGEYGGGPATIKPRKYWWGKEDRDPVGNTDDFIWNKDFLPHMERVIANGGADAEPTITRLSPVCISSSLTEPVRFSERTRMLRRSCLKPFIELRV
jgi:ATP synthase protein I